MHTTISMFFSILFFEIWNHLVLFTENLALKKQTYQQHPYPAPIGPIHTELIQASNAVDGLKSNLSIWGGQCVVSDNEQQTATWWVNLNNIVSIRHITVYYRTGNAIWGMFLQILSVKEYKLNMNTE